MPRICLTSRARSSEATSAWPISPVGPVMATVSSLSGARAGIARFYRIGEHDASARDNLSYAHGRDPHRAGARRSTMSRACRLRDARAAGGLLQAGPCLAHERDGLGEDAGDECPNLIRLRLGVALQVDPGDRSHGHLDREADRVVGPCEALVALHLIGELGQPPLQLVRVAKDVTEPSALHVAHHR